MATLTIELPDELMIELNEQQVSNEFIDLLVEQTLRIWLRKAPEIRSKQDDDNTSPFTESAATFTEQLINENQELFERLAQL